MPAESPPPPSEGVIAIPDIWPAFVRAVLEVTIEGYQAMRRAEKAQKDWEEDVFTLRLVDYIQPIAWRHPLNLTVRSQIPVHTPEMRAAGVSPKKAVKIDIQLNAGGWEDYNRAYFAWEAKLILDRYVERKHERLIREYTTEGIFRFINEEYAKDVDDAGMLGYVLAGEPSDIAHAINVNMLTMHKVSDPSIATKRQRSLSEFDHLEKADPIGSFANIYRSCHKREPSGRKITLHHLFLTFEFD